MILKLSQPYPSCYKVPVIKYVDDTIFTQHSFCLLDCMHDSCKDLCCYRGEDASKSEIERIMKYQCQLQPLLSTPIEKCFGSVFIEDDDYPSGSYTRTKVINGKCVFLKDKGCILHSIALANNIDFHELKPISGSLFPVSFNYGLLQPSH